MNNLEKLLQNNEEGKTPHLGNVLRSWIDVPCDYCIISSTCKGHITGKECIEHRARWLLEEYVEPDSWEKIEEDAKKDLSQYWGCVGVSCVDCPVLINGVVRPSEHYCINNCIIAQKLDLIARCKKLAGVEE